MNPSALTQIKKTENDNNNYVNDYYVNDYYKLRILYILKRYFQRYYV